MNKWLHWNLPTYLAIFFRLVLLLLPTAILVGEASRDTGNAAMMLWLGTAFQLTVCFLSFVSSQSWRQPLGPSVITLYLIALAWLWFADTRDDWYTHFSKAVLLIVPMLVFGLHTLMESGAPKMRWANILAQRLAARQEWPADLTACRTLPEVKALRAALGNDASPALWLLQHERLEVRVAGMATLEFRKEWLPGQAELVLQIAQRTEHPQLRAAAVTALANLEDRALVETLAQFLHDTSREVRKAAIEAMMWDTEHRWGWIRFSVRRILADPLFFSDGPLTSEGQLLTQEAVNDLTAWCAEKGMLANRAAITLAAHYHRALSERTEAKILDSLRAQLADPHTPAVLRLELGKLLQDFQELDQEILQKMLDPANPAPLRLIACESLLAEQISDSVKASAVHALRDLARLPNREISLSTANVIQKRLGVDLGLGLDQPLPPLHSRQAADITRRVMQWANQYDAQDGEEELEDSRLVRHASVDGQPKS